MQAHLVRWHKEFAKKGLVLIDVDNGDVDSLEDLKKSVASENVPYLTAWDEGGKTCEKYDVQSYPTSYLIGVDGKVAWEGFALGGGGKIDKKVEEQLTQELARVSKEELEKIKKGSEK